MKKLIAIVSTLSVFILIFTFFAFSSLPAFDSEENDSGITQIAQNSQDVMWKDTFKKVDAYYTAPVAPKPTPKPTPPPPPPPLTIKDSRLVGIVTEPKAKAFIVIARQSAIKELEIGEQWVAPWQLSQAKGDHVIWINQTTKEEFIQYLF